MNYYYLPTALWHMAYRFWSYELKNFCHEKLYLCLMYALYRYKLLLPTSCVHNFWNSEDLINEIYHRNVQLNSWNSLFRINHLVCCGFLFSGCIFKKIRKFKRYPKGLIYEWNFFFPHKSQVSNLKMLLGSCIFLTAVFMTDCRVCLWQHFLLQIFTGWNALEKLLTVFFTLFLILRGLVLHGDSQLFFEFLLSLTSLFFTFLIFLQSHFLLTDPLNSKNSWWMEKFLRFLYENLSTRFCLLPQRINMERKGEGEEKGRGKGQGRRGEAKWGKIFNEKNSNRNWFFIWRSSGKRAP